MPNIFYVIGVVVVVLAVLGYLQIGYRFENSNHRTDGESRLWVGRQ